MIRAMASEKMGLGHLVRSACLAGELQKCGLEIYGFWVNDRTLFERIHVGNIPRARVLTDGDTRQINELIASGQVDCLLVDQAVDFSPQALQLKSRNPQVLTVALDPPVLNSNAYDLIFSLFNHGTETRVDFVPERYFLGLDYALIRPQFTVADPSLIRKCVEHVLVSCGGTDPSRITLKTIESLAGVPRQTWHLHIVIGSGFPHSEEVRRKASGFSWTHTLYENVQDMAELMRLCDIGLISPGATLMEMCALGKPSITIAHNEQEVRFARSFHTSGATHFLGEAAELETKNIADALLVLCNNLEDRKLVAERANCLVDGKGGGRIAQILLERMAAVTHE
jgi:UDP-2,4-diacetamido-2,4,6-trideoxy-beta-L-altropyranose hydrolase